MDEPPETETSIACPALTVITPVLDPDTDPGAMTQVVDELLVNALPPLNVVMSTRNVSDAPAADLGPAQ